MYLLPNGAILRPSMALRVLLVGGGSIGHVAPLIAVWREVQALHPDAQARVLCADRPEELAFCRTEGLDATGLPRLQLNAGLPGAFMRASAIADRALRDIHPDIIFCKGGSISIPVCRLAKRMDIPIVLHESDAVMGRANSMLCRWADTVCVGMDAQGTWKAEYVVTGNPVRREIMHGNHDEGLRIAGLNGKKPVVIICGGSQGAQTINEAVQTQLPALLPCCDIIHLTGPGKNGARPQPGYFPLPFAHAELPHLYAASDLAVSRAGAGTMSELAACGIPMLLIPIRGLAQDHQWRNAQAMAAAGCAEILPQEHLGEMTVRVTALLEDSGRRAAMAAAGTVGSGEAARRIAKIVVDCVASRRADA